ncbi:MAG: hypothetical protein GF332_01655 [Candidatus Moranbacteria bacterium]|nr:hypothetical protein [Candidatus Moranbacteria bacterium]
MNKLNFWQKQPEGSSKNALFNADDLNISPQAFQKAEQEARKKRKKRGLIKTSVRWLLAIVIMGILIMFGFFYYQQNQKAQALDKELYLKSRDFAVFVELVNDLATEKTPKTNGESKDLYIKRMEKEKQDIEQTLTKLEEIKSKDQENQWYYLESHSKLKDFYNQAQQLLTEYYQLYTYEIKSEQHAVNLEAQKNKFEILHKTTENVNELKGPTDEFMQAVDQSIQELQKLQPPTELQAYHNKSITFMESYSLILHRISQGLEKKINGANELEYLKAVQVYNEFVEDGSTVKNLEKIREYYYQEIQDKFKNLRRQADETKELLIRESEKTDAEIARINIEHW